MTSNTKKTITHYSEKAQHYYDLYNSVDAESVHGDWKAFLQDAKAGTALDVGAGSGRDANWLAEQGWKVIAAEPADELRNLAQANSHNSVTWCDASLPALTALPQRPKTYDLILLSAVWMHLPEAERPPALNRLAELLSENGTMYISFRFGPNDEARPMHPVSYGELATLAKNNGLTARNLNPVPSQDGLKRDDVKWVTVEVVKG
ncbi:class I SAM-dependent methyltransferase [Alteromonas sp. BL110]|uniref:class I SAM-dependent methyltransferase n=1 Tax=Alteromonas sp. BL110 TaxID=1714845 RepID=UPI000E540B6F|nr:class I SAM-dependent methyltransferase [Alteromonas sp. BL110]AXT40761.1 class I SAM-dependent methyltransferase [Alteromonas sp. BL110]RKM84013.1 methyltransferase domain-containing protein [Alteromonas sp. BL110]